MSIILKANSGKCACEDAMALLVPFISRRRDNASSSFALLSRRPKRPRAGRSRSPMRGCKDGSTMKSFKDFRREALENPDVKAAYDALEEEYALARALIQARQVSGLTQEELAERMHTT